MKTKNNSSRVATTLPAVVVLFAVLFMAVACNNKKDNEKQENASSVSNVKPPQVDIHTAVLTENVEALQQHIAASSNLNEKDPFGGSSPLITAAVFNKPKMAQMLIDAGADINFQNSDGSTALHSAAFFCRLEIVKMLLDKGADKTIKNKYGATPYETVKGPFGEVKGAYDMMGKMLEPMGLKLDYAYVEKTRPVIADLLK
jgi:hypothetical protein